MKQPSSKDAGAAAVSHPFVMSRTSMHGERCAESVLAKTTSNCLLRLLASQLDTFVHGTQALMLQTTALWQNLGLLMRGVGHNDRLLAECEACGRICSQFFVICSEDSPTSMALVEKLQQAYLRQLTQS